MLLKEALHYQAHHQVLVQVQNLVQALVLVLALEWAQGMVLLLAAVRGLVADKHCIAHHNSKL